MTAPTTFTATGSYYHPDGTAATGIVTFVATDARFVNNANIVVRQPLTTTITAGAMASTTLIQATNGYDVTERINGLDGTTHVQQFHIAGTGNLSITT